jgi:hypothetical protein
LAEKISCDQCTRRTTKTQKQLETPFRPPKRGMLVRATTSTWYQLVEVLKAGRVHKKTHIPLAKSTT